MKVITHMVENVKIIPLVSVFVFIKYMKDKMKKRPKGSPKARPYTKRWEKKLF